MASGFGQEFTLCRLCFIEKSDSKESGLLVYFNSNISDLSTSSSPMSTAADDVDETPGVGGGDGNGTPPELVDDVPAVGGGGGNGNNVDNALQPAQMGQGLGQGSLPQVANLAEVGGGLGIAPPQGIPPGPNLHLNGLPMWVMGHESQHQVVGPDFVRDQQSLFSTPPHSFNLSSLLAALPASTPAQAQQLAGLLSQFGSLNVGSASPQMSLSVSQLSAVVQQLVTDHSNLLSSKKELDIQRQVSMFTNPMSKRAVEGLLRMDDAVDRICKILTVGGAVVIATATNFTHVNTIIKLVLGGLQEMKDRVKSDMNKYEVSIQSPLGWRFVSDMEKLEGSVGSISRAELRAQEQIYLRHEALLLASSKAATSKNTQGGGGGAAVGKGKGKGKGAGKVSAADQATKKKKGGGVGKPKRGGCHRCRGPHFVRACPKPIPTGDDTG